MAVTGLSNGEIQVNGATLYYEIAGEGETLLFAHAGIADSRMWDNQFEAFSNSHRVLRYDMRGAGRSSPQEGEFAHRDDLVALLDALEIEQVHGVGNSDGARVLLELALIQPQRLASLTLVAPNIEGFDWRERYSLPYETEIESLLAIADYEQATELVAKRWLDGNQRKVSAVPRALRRALQEMIIIPLRNSNRYEAEEGPLTPPINDRLAEIDVNTLLVIGDLDLPIFHEMADRLQQNLRRFRKVTMTSTAHLPSMERPEEFNWRLLHFLRRGR